MIGFVFVSWIAGTFFGSDARGMTLDEITKQRYGNEIDENGWFVTNQDSNMTKHTA